MPVQGKNHFSNSDYRHVMFTRILNAILFSVRVLCSHKLVNKLGLRSLRDERCDSVMELSHGRLLDIGCGNNQLVNKYGHDSVGVDIFDFGRGATIIEDASKLPFLDRSFDTVSFVASLNHINNRSEVLREVYRLLSDHGTIVLTMISPLVGSIRHKFAWWDDDQSKRGIKNDEKMGLSHEDILSLFESEGYILVSQRKIIYGLNNIYVFQKARK